VWQLGLILLVACTGKLVGATVGARSRGVPMRESVALGILMNTRGLTELVVLDIGRQLGVLDRPLFTLLVVMAVVTTVATAPLLQVLGPDPTLGEGDVGPSAAATG
jgi:Kef-type K+ transport system membrane component KefB